jgi:hypothetical protein
VRQVKYASTGNRYDVFVGYEETRDRSGGGELKQVYVYDFSGQFKAIGFLSPIIMSAQTLFLASISVLMVKLN